MVGQKPCRPELPADYADHAEGASLVTPVRSGRLGCRDHRGTPETTKTHRIAPKQGVRRFCRGSWNPKWCRRSPLAPPNSATAVHDRFASHSGVYRILPFFTGKRFSDDPPGRLSSGGRSLNASDCGTLARFHSAGSRNSGPLKTPARGECFAGSERRAGGSKV